MTKKPLMNLEDRIKLLEYLEEKTAKLEHWGYLINQQIERLRSTISIQKDLIEKERSKQGPVD